MALPSHKTKIVSTIGPSSNSPETMEAMIMAGMDIARLNFSHGDFAAHKTVIDNLRAASSKTGKRITIMADLPGPKMRVGLLEKEPIVLRANDNFTLTTDDIVGNGEKVSVSFNQLPAVVKPGNAIYL